MNKLENMVNMWKYQNPLVLFSSLKLQSYFEYMYFSNWQRKAWTSKHNGKYSYHTFFMVDIVERFDSNLNKIMDSFF